VTQQPSFAAGTGPLDPRWQGLRTLVVARLVVAAIAVPAGVLWWPGAGSESRWVMTTAMLSVGALSALLALGVRLRRGYGFQVGLQLGIDLVLISALAAWTGGRASQFVPFYALTVVTGGVLGGLRGGIVISLGACAGYLALPALTGGFGGVNADPAGLPQPVLLAPLLAAVGALAGVLGRRAETARVDLARASRELDRVRFDQDVILRHLTSGVITLDAEARLVFLNPAAEDVLELRGEDLRGRRVDEAFPNRLAPLYDALLAALERRETRIRGELLMRTAHGRPLPVGLSTNLLDHEGQSTGVVAVFQDLTEVREMEHRARRNQTLAEVGALAAGIAHELRNGIKPISGSVEFLQRELKLEGENAQLMDLIAAECGRLNRFVTDLLSYARERELVREDVDCRAAFADVAEALRRDARCQPGVRFVFDAPGDGDVLVHADQEQLRQVWINLAINALEAMGDRGTLTVRWRPAEGERVVVEFIDDGPGIPAEDLRRVGEPFFTTKRGGTGLGLAIAQRIVERHGGTLEIESPPGRGTCARVALPGAAVVLTAAA
jgi:two-component system sensor histidine kinase PilS (NtrC family)